MPRPAPNLEPNPAPTTVGGAFREGVWGRGRRLRAALSIAGFCGHQLAEVMVPVAVGVVIDRAIAPHDPVALGWALVFLVAVFAVLICAWQVGDRSATVVYARGEHALRQGVLGLALRRRVRRPAGEVLTISSSDAGQTAGFFWVIAEQAAAATAVLVACITLLVIAWPLAIAVVIGTLVQAFVVHAVSGGLRRRGYAAQKQAARLDAVSTDFATGLRVLGALGGAPRAAERYVAESAVAAEAAYRAEKATAGLTALNLLVSGLAFTGIAMLGGRLALEGAITVGGFVTAMGLAQTIRGPLQALGYLPAQIASKHGSATRIAEFTAEAEMDAAEAGADAAEAGADAVERMPVTDAVAAAAGGVPAGGVVARLDVDGRPIEIRAGELTGIRADPARIADLARLFGGQREPEVGELLLTGTDAARLDAEGLRSRVFAPPHDAAVFSGTAAENIADPIDAAHLEASAFDEVLRRLPDGLDERVGERGLRLSGGQRQRLLLARALHQPQPLLVLHEPTTAIDPITEAQVAEGLARDGRTILLLTDRASLLAACAHVHDLRDDPDQRDHPDPREDPDPRDDRNPRDDPDQRDDA
ncbi:ABC transporter transmembrane domain-containing protein [Microbacterium galbinum]|uniref:ABC transporter ATP-binding protein/permease n=1 Tax=Microbacterium galbinum TaxID=2851646 RepID=A0ABY4IL97_9MICO|nr:ABC transporter ATP-binding protein [Microbacterium galbinum]UPL13547.1 ABC transporter ATP-binding protein/permease [Microbacterium galbinum]